MSAAASHPSSTCTSTSSPSASDQSSLATTDHGSRPRSRSRPRPRPRRPIAVRQTFSDPEGFDALSGPVSDALHIGKHALDHQLIQFCDLPIRSPQTAGLDYVIDHTGPDLFEPVESVQALERILNSHLFGLTTPQALPHPSDHHLTSFHAPRDNSSETSDSNILNNDRLFQPTSACFEHDHQSESHGVHYHHPIALSSPLDHTSAHACSRDTPMGNDLNHTNSLGLLSDGMPIDPRLHGGFPIAQDFLNTFESPRLSTGHIRSGSGMLSQLEEPGTSSIIDSPTSFALAEASGSYELPSFSHSPEQSSSNPTPTRQPRARAAKSRSSRRRPSSSISAMLINGQTGARANSSLKPDVSPATESCTLSSSTHDPNVHPLLQELAFDPQLPTTPPSPSRPIKARKRARSSATNNSPPHSSFFDTFNPGPLPITSSYLSMSLSQVDVHGAGAGGGAAAVLAAAAAPSSSNTLPLTTDLLSSYVCTPFKPHVPMPTSPFIDAEPVPESYNPDQFRAFNRIHWTQSEEELLLEEVEMNWQRYDCMAHIMKRHGPQGTVSRTFSDRTGVSLKDKAVNISSRWYRDGTELSEIRKRAFARFRPKQLRGKLRSELPGMMNLVSEESPEPEPAPEPEPEPEDSVNGSRP